MLAGTSALVLITILTVFTLALIWCCKKYITLYLRFPGVMALPFLIKYYILMEKKEVPATSYFIQTVIHVCRRFQKEGFFIFWAQRPYLFLFGEETMKVFSSEISLIDKIIEFDMVKEVFGSGLLTSSGDKWRNRKKLLNPMFHKTLVRDKVSIVNKSAVVLVETLREQTNNPFLEIEKFLNRCCFVNLSEFLIGSDFDGSNTISELEYIVGAIKKGIEMVVNATLQPWLAPEFMVWLSSERRDYINVMNKARENAIKILKEKIELFKSARTVKKELSPTCFIEMMIEHHLNDPSFTFDDMLDEFYTFITAGYNSVGYGMMWCLFLLGHHPEVQDLVYEEVEAVLRNDMKYEELHHFRYLDCVIKESLRLYPPLPLYGRVLAKPVSWGRYTVPEGTSVIFFPFMAHRDPDVFPDPEKFDPDRFLDGQSEKKPTYVFAEGRRSCLGRKSAEIEMKVTLAHIIKNFKIISLDHREDIKLNWTIFMTTVEPLRMQLAPRK